MKQNMRNGSNINNGIFGRLAAEKGKAVIAACLFTVVVFMWVRVLGKNGPQSADAAVASQKATAGRMNSRLKISFIELPKVGGRNDVLTRDFFTVGDWRDFMRDGEGKSGGIKKVRVVSRDSGLEAARRVAERLELETIVLGENPRAFINGRLLSVGDKLFIGDGIDTCECEVTEIEGNTVFIRCGDKCAGGLEITAED